MRYWLELILAVPFASLPRRYWQSIDLPVSNVIPVSSMLTMFTGFAVGIVGYFKFLDAMRGVKGTSILEVGQAQVAGTVAESAEVSAAPLALAALAPMTFALFTPLGLLATYLVLSGMARGIASYTGEPFGDPILTGIDTLARKLFTKKQRRAVSVARARLEKVDEPDRRYDGEWAGLADVDFVIVAARRKPGWTKGTWVITDDGWFVLGEPFDRPMPNGLRTVYPLKAQTTLEPVRKSVNYELPKLRANKAIEKK